MTRHITKAASRGCRLVSSLRELEEPGWFQLWRVDDRHRAVHAWMR